jgi:hypothetical protein
MDKKYELLIEEGKKLFFIYLFSLLAFYIAFWKSGILTSLKVSGAIFYLYILPGFVILHFISDLKFIEKFFLGAVIGFVVVTVVSFHLNIFLNISLKASQIVPLIVVSFVIGVDYFLSFRKNHKKR